MARARRVAQPFTFRWLPAGLIGVFLATLALTALREELIEIRYEIIAGVDEETRLREERDQWILRVQELRNPARLVALADQHGFARPEHAIDLRAHRDRSAVASRIEASVLAANLSAGFGSAGGASR